MALKTNELFSSTTKSAFPRIAPTRVFVRKLTNDAGAPTLAVGTPLVYDAANDEWRTWVDADAGTNQIDGFLYPDEVTLDATNQSLAQVMVAGSIHRDDVALPAGQTQATLDTDLLDNVREGLFVTEQSGAR